MTHNIVFPSLGLDFTINRVACTLFGKDIYWYGIIICCGFLLASFYMSRRVAEFGLTVDQEVDVILWALPISLIFARAYYVFFEWDSYKGHWMDALKIWNGGIAVYGSILGAVLVMYVYAKRHRIPVLDVLDVASLGLLIGQSIGRWGNFVNAEAHGGETSLPWRMVIDGAAGVHPTFFYESIWNAIGFFLLHFRSKKRRFSGELFLLYIAWYGFGRMLIEGLRTDSLYVLNTDLRISQVVAAFSCVIAIALLVRGYRNHRVYAVAREIQLPTDAANEETANTEK